MTNDDKLFLFMTEPLSLKDVWSNEEYKTIRESAEKLRKRISNKNDSDGILTASRALIESVCKSLLDSLNIEYDKNADLSDISKKLIKALDLHPASCTDHALKQIFQGAISMVNGIASVRNEHSDSHGKGMDAENLPFRHAEFLAYMACSLTRYLVESFESKISRKSFATLDDSQRTILVNIWLDIGQKYRMTNPDGLPYTEALEEISQQFTKETRIVLPRREVYRGLQNLRKANKLPKPELDK